MSFVDLPSTFNRLAVQGDDGVEVLTSVVTDTGSMYLDGDVEDSYPSPEPYILTLYKPHTDPNYKAQSY